MSLDKASFEPNREMARMCRFAIITAGYNPELVDSLYRATHDTLIKHGVNPQNVERHSVPGSNEIPYLANMLGLTGEYEGIIGLGVVIAGDTQHHEMIERTTAVAMQQIGMTTEIPVINGVITTETRAQAEARCGEKINRGEEFALAAMHMAQHKLMMIERLERLDMQDRARRNTLENN